MHSRNAVDRYIFTWKNHFIEGLCGALRVFPMHLWGRLIKQYQITLNPLRTAISNPKFLVQMPLEGVLDFNRTPLAHPVTKVIIHDETGQGKYWDSHSVEVWYWVTSM